MFSNVDYIAKYLEISAVSAKKLFDDFYGHDGDWLRGKWERKEGVPFRLNQWCEEKAKRIQAEVREKQRVLPFVGTNVYPMRRK
jgi:hypothetical protein